MMRNISNILRYGISALAVVITVKLLHKCAMHILYVPRKKQIIQRPINEAEFVITSIGDDWKQTNNNDYLSQLIIDRLDSAKHLVCIAL